MESGEFIGNSNFRIISLEEGKKAAENGIFLEITSRKGHSLSNGHVVEIARKSGAKLLVNTDTHSPSDFIDQEFAYKVAMAAGLSEEEAYEVVVNNPLEIMKRIK